MSYKLLENGYVLRLSDNACIPPDPSNRDYQEYLKWVDAGNTPLPPYTVQELKDRKLQEAQVLARQHVEAVYPDIKQRSDLADREYYVSYLLNINSTYTTDNILKQAQQHALNIINNGSTIAQEIQSYPAQEQDAWSQLIKIQLRVIFVQDTKAQYRQHITQINNLTTLNDLENYQIQYTTQLHSEAL